jgi:shikimate dehydrogenase
MTTRTLAAPVAIAGTTRVAAVLGHPVEHSLSPVLHNAAFAHGAIDAVFVPFAVPPEALAAAVAGLRALGVLGASITVPHKQAVLDHCSDLAPLARAVGAVNCLEFTPGGVVGHNTDAGGFVDALVEAGLTPRGLRAVLLGAGGAARAVCAGLREAGAAQIAVVARTPGRATWVTGGARSWVAAELDALLGAADLLVDCTSTGLGEQAERAVPAPVPLERLPATAWVASLVYHREPALLAQARQRGLRTVDGAGMLVHQGARAFQIWTGRPAPVAIMRAAFEQALRVAIAQR